MLTSGVDGQRMMRNGENAEESASTPLRGNWSGFPRMRLTEKDFKLEQVPVYTLPPRSSQQEQFELRTHEFKTVPLVHRTAILADRFIPRRQGQNLDASRYYLLNKVKQSDCKYGSAEYLDVISQIKSLNDSWRKRLMVRAMVQHDIVKGLGSRRVLNVRSKSPSGTLYISRNINGTKESIADYDDNNTWRVKSRNKPLLGEYRHKISMPNRNFPPRGSIDWSSKDCIVSPIDYSLHFFSFLDYAGCTKRTHMSITVESSFPGSKQIRCLKWNNAGNRVAIYAKSLTICVFDVQSTNVIWSDECVCTESCDVKCLLWSNDDKELITGCNMGRISIFQANKDDDDHLFDNIRAHDGQILQLALSSNNRYLASTGMDKRVRIFLFPDMMLWLEIGYYDATQSLAWHPWDSRILCIGGGIGDGSLSLWDISAQQSVGYKRVAFFGYVKNMIWNKMSGELVVQWNYYEDDNRFVTVPVMASWDRIVDVAAWNHQYGTGVANMIWNPDHTKLGIQLTNYTLIWDFFGYEVSDWGRKHRDEEKKAHSAGRKSALNGCCLR